VLVISRIEACDWFYRRFTVMLVFLSPNLPREGEGILIVESNCDFHVLELVASDGLVLRRSAQRTRASLPWRGSARTRGRGGYPRGGAERRGGFPFPSGEEPVLSLPKDEDGSGLCHAR
jgi:hypothetical protein